VFAVAMREKVKSQTSNLSKNAENGLRLTWVCVEVKLFGLFMEFSSLFMGISGEERGERRRLDW